ncbi:uncharacterized protein TRIADDRAFT_62580 [Trichoplax adhaerens]|uniref:Uncharacterized protein n=1 Tax=Trichoplax adhaerens TaxID=10228 RepID=B3SE82_TRIAD|nr:predicted protein [Trichoplax adhaerens]EDV18962.1 predicted protein [Trichoplax adhaerens]|eukprot:XP_002118551.1 predicted protein [Trichoplax adhaerens]
MGSFCMDCTYVDWGFYEYDPKHDCVLMTSFTAGYKWKNVLCSTITWSLCERGSLKYGSTTPSAAAAASAQASVSKPKIYFYTTDATTKISANSVLANEHYSLAADTIYKQIQSSTAGLRTISSLNGISLNRCAVYCNMILACDEFTYMSFMVNDTSENVCTILTASS